MKKTVLLIMLLMITAVTLLFFALTAPRQQIDQSKRISSPAPTPVANTVLSFSPRIVQFDASGNASVDITIDTGYNKVTGVQLELGYDADVLTNVQVSPGTFLPSAVVLLENNAVPGRYSYMLGLAPSKNPISGVGTIATVRFQRNINNQEKTQSMLTIMPKSLVTSLGIEGTVLKKADSLTITLPQVSKSPMQTPVITTVSPTYP
jgi:hypothetical protein